MKPDLDEPIDLADVTGGEADGIRALVCRIARLSDIDVSRDLYDAGLQSACALELLLELESLFDVVLSDSEFIKCRNVRDLELLVQRARQS
jgi:acyl carrier protein